MSASEQIGVISLAELWSELITALMLSLTMAHSETCSVTDS